ncbi:MAG: ArnT family glycosyltransferase [Anaerolineae bacterium]
MGSAPKLQRRELWALVAILLVAAATRLIALVDVPPGLRYDELLNYRMAERVLAGERPLYFTESWGHEPLFHYTQAAVIELTEASDWSLRLPAALCGLLGVLTTWLAARRLFCARVAILTAAGLAVSFWAVFYSRQGLRIIGIVPPSGLMIYFLWRGLERVPKQRRRATVDLAVGGLFLGSLFYVYMAARVLPLLPIVLALYLALFHRSRFRSAWPGLLLFVVIAALVAAPLVLLLYRNPEMEQRVGQLASVLAALKEGRVGPLLLQAVQALGVFVWRGQEDWLYNIYGRPIFDPLTTACFVLGAGLCIWQWRRTRYVLLVLWLAAGVLPAIAVPPPASLNHTIAALPPAYTLVAVGLEALWRVARKWRRWAGPLLAVGIIALHGALSCHAYFVTWAGAPEVRELYQGGIAAVARELDARAPPGPVAIGAPYVNYWHPWNALGFDLRLRREDLSVRWFNPAGGWVWPAGTGPATFYFPTDPLGPQTFDPALKALFMADAMLLPAASDDFAAFRLARPEALEARLRAVADAPLAWPPELAHLLPPKLPLVFGDRFALLGVELQENTAPAGGEFHLITYWRVLRADPAPVVAFVHLTSDGRDIWGQQDWLDVRPAGLQPGDRFVQVHRVPVKPGTPPGLYHVQLGLYGPDTLLRLSIATGAEGTADRVWVGEIQAF